MKQQFEQLGFYHFIETQPTFNKRRQSFKLSIFRFKHSIIEGKFLARYGFVDTIFGHVSFDTRMELMGCRSADGAMVTSLQGSC